MKPVSKNIVVTGGGGFIASHLIDHLIKKKFNVLSLSRNPIRLPDRNPKCTYATVDLADFNKLESAIKPFNPDTVYHMASCCDAKESYSHTIQSINDNLRGTVNLLEVFNTCEHARALIYGDSVKVYGNSQVPYHTKTLTLPNSSYAITKLAGWSFCELYGRSSHFNVIAVRPTLVFGPKQPVNLIRYVIDSILSGKTEITLMGGEQTRSPLFIEDAIDAYLRAAEVAMEKNLKVMIIGGKSETSVIDIARRIAQLMESNVSINVDKKEVRSTEIARSYVDLVGAYDEFKWSPKYSLTDGLVNTIAAYTKHTRLQVDVA